MKDVVRRHIGEVAPFSERNFAEEAKSILKAALKRRGMTYKDLADRLCEQGIAEDERNVRNKLSRGTFSAVYFLQCLTVIGVMNVPISPLYEGEGEGRAWRHEARRTKS